MKPTVNRALPRIVGVPAAFFKIVARSKNFKQVLNQQGHTYGFEDGPNWLKIKNAPG